jgi:class 3 adenylate cyclase
MGEEMISSSTRKPTVEYKGIQRAILLFAAFFALLYLGQGGIIRARLSQIGSAKIELGQKVETCDSLNCTATWKITPKHRFLVLGHILRTHELTETDSGKSLIPVTQLHGTQADSWATMRVYLVTPGIELQLKATKYRSIKVDYFIGLLPRETDHEGVLSIPAIGPTVSSISGLVLTLMLIAMFSMAYMGSSGIKGDRAVSRSLLSTFAVSAFFATTAAFVSLGILDTLLPEGEARNILLRFSAINALAFPVASQLLQSKLPNPTLRVPTGLIIITIFSYLFWPWIKGGMTWGLILGGFQIIGCLMMASKRLWLPAILWSVAIVDSAKIMGYIATPDYPPIYFNNVTSLCALILAAGHLGGFATISMSAVAYRRFRRDLLLSSITESIEIFNQEKSESRLSQLHLILPEIAKFVGAGRVSITISLPLGRPITHSFDSTSGEIKLYDDGKIPGAVTLRSMVYGDEAIFDSFEDFRGRFQLPTNTNLSDSRYFCAIPLRVNQTIVGTLMLTRFDDHLIDRKKLATNSKGLDEDRETIKLVADRFSQSLSKLMVENLDLISDLSRNLQTAIRKDIAASNGTDEFLRKFTQSVSMVCGTQVLLHEHVDDKGVALASFGVKEVFWNFFWTNPFNLASNTRPAFGPTVVAFKEQKNNYVKDIGEIMDRMHPKTQSILGEMNVRSIIAIPIKTAQRSFVVTLLTEKTQAPAEPALTAVVEATEALFVAAIEVMSQKTSVLALGQLASRLIGDDEVRSKILNAAKDRTLATTIGSPRCSFLLLFDLAGSSDLPSDTEAKALAYGKFYDAVNQKCQEVLGGMIRKTIGDAVIVTWDGTGVSLNDNATLLSDLEKVTNYADLIAKGLGCRGARAILHFGYYFLGLVGTKTFGQIDVIGSAIDEVCKMEARLKELRTANRKASLAISATAAEKLSNFGHQAFEDSGYTPCGSEGSVKYQIQYALFERAAMGDQNAA